MGAVADYHDKLPFRRREGLPVVDGKVAAMGNAQGGEMVGRDMIENQSEAGLP